MLKPERNRGHGHAGPLFTNSSATTKHATQDTDGHQSIANPSTRTLGNGPYRETISFTFGHVAMKHPMTHEDVTGSQDFTTEELQGCREFLTGKIAYIDQHPLLLSREELALHEARKRSFYEIHCACLSGDSPSYPPGWVNTSKGLSHKGKERASSIRSMPGSFPGSVESLEIIQEPQLNYVNGAIRIGSNTGDLVEEIVTTCPRRVYAMYHPLTDEDVSKGISDLPLHKRTVILAQLVKALHRRQAAQILDFGIKRPYHEIPASIRLESTIKLLQALGGTMFDVRGQEVRHYRESQRDFRNIDSGARLLESEKEFYMYPLTQAVSSVLSCPFTQREDWWAWAGEVVADDSKSSSDGSSSSSSSNMSASKISWHT